jgi:hypothetical protein
MYDTIHLFKHEDRAGSLLALTPQFLENVTEHFRDGRYSVSGSLNNLRVNVFESGISIKGSLAKYFLNDNIQTLRRQDTARAIEQLSDQLHIDINEAHLSRLDFSHNFLMDNKPEVYYPYLGDSQYFKRYIQPNSLYYKNGNRTKLFYDKLSEAVSKAVRVPEIFNGRHLLRYEISYSRRLPKQLKEPEVSAGALSNETFYIKLIDRYISEYQSIHKNAGFNIDKKKMKTPKDVDIQIILMAIDIIGHDKYIQFIDELKADNAMARPEYYSRLKKQFRERCKKYKASDSTHLIEELDKKVSSLKRYYR